MIGQIVGKLFGSSKAVSDITSGITKGLDAIVFTDEEKSKLAKDVLFKLQDQWMPRALSRRVLAVMVTSVFCLFLLVSLVFACLKQAETISLIIDTAKAFQLGWIQLTVIVFYFGYYGFLQKGK